MHTTIQKIAEFSAKLNVSKPVQPEEQERRLRICVDCDHFKGDATCALCGCYMPYKTGWETILGVKITCPDNRW